MYIQVYYGSVPFIKVLFLMFGFTYGSYSRENMLIKTESLGVFNPCSLVK